MKKLLILAYDFPPYVSVGGLRPYNWFYYLKEFDIEPIVVTRQWSSSYSNERDYVAYSETKEPIIETTERGTIVSAPYFPNAANRLYLKHGDKRFNFLRRSISAFYEFSQFLLPLGPKRSIYLAARDYLKENKVDAIIATGDPFILFKYARDLSGEFQVPWIADYRDPWTTNKTNFISKYFKPWNWFFERGIVKKAHLITTVDAVFKRRIEEIVGQKTIELLPNGYDPRSFESLEKITQRSDALRIGFVGTIYAWHPVKTVLNTLAKYIDLNPDQRIELHFYGINQEKELNEIISREFSSIQGNIFFTPRLANDELIHRLAHNNVVLLFNYYAYMGTKIYDYLALRRKILLCFTEDTEAEKLKTLYYNIEELPGDNSHVQADLIHETNSGIVVKDAAHLMEVLEELWEEFSATGQIACESHGVEKYSRKVQVEKLAEIVKGL